MTKKRKENLEVEERESDLGKKKKDNLNQKKLIELKRRQNFWLIILLYMFLAILGFIFYFRHFYSLENIVLAVISGFFMSAGLFFIYKQYTNVYESREYLEDEIRENREEEISFTEAEKEEFEDEYIISMESAFEDLKSEYEFEEADWLSKVNLYFYLLLTINTLYFFGIFDLSSLQLFKDHLEIYFIPLEILLFSMFYFSIVQYSKAKNLRIENQNKIAAVNGFYGLKSDSKAYIKDFLPNISNVLFNKLRSQKDKNLPIDEIIKLAKVLRK